MESRGLVIPSVSKVLGIKGDVCSLKHSFGTPHPRQCQGQVGLWGLEQWEVTLPWPGWRCFEVPSHPNHSGIVFFR